MFICLVGWVLVICLFLNTMIFRVKRQKRYHGGSRPRGAKRSCQEVYSRSGESTSPSQTRNMTEKDRQTDRQQTERLTERQGEERPFKGDVNGKILTMQ